MILVIAIDGPRRARFEVVDESHKVISYKNNMKCAMSYSLRGKLNEDLRSCVD